jgi:hypothetical protein
MECWLSDKFSYYLSSTPVEEKNELLKAAYQDYIK